jgi:hypothetical protein
MSALKSDGRILTPSPSLGEAERAMKATGASKSVDLDLIEEFRLRRWARENYVPGDKRDESWHPIVLDEMTRKDRERREPALAG